VTYTHSTSLILYLDLVLPFSLSPLSVMEDSVFEKVVSKERAFGPWE
jgi:hypothetical protein